MDSVLNVVHIYDGRLYGRQLGGNWRSICRLEESRAEIISCEWQAPSEGERDEMTAAAAEAIIVVGARLAIALVGETCDMASTFAFINW